MGWYPGSGRMKALGGLVVILLLGLAIVGYEYSLSTSQVSSVDSSLTSASSQLSSAQSQLSSAQSQLTSVESQLSTAQASASALGRNATSLQGIVNEDNAQISGDASQITSLQGQVASANQTIATFKSENKTATAQEAALQANITSDENTISSLKSQEAGLQSQITSLEAVTALSSSKVEVSNATYTEPAGAVGQFKQFAAGYAGFLLIVGSGNSTNFYIGVNLVFPSPIDGQFGETESYLFGAGGSYVLVIPVTPGITQLSLGNYDTSGVDMATLTVVYYY